MCPFRSRLFGSLAPAFARGRSISSCDSAIHIFDAGVLLPNIATRESTTRQSQFVSPWHSNTPTWAVFWGEDADCNRVICDNIATSTPIEARCRMSFMLSKQPDVNFLVQVYANESDWAPFKNLCGHLQDVVIVTRWIGFLDVDGSD